MGKLGKHDHKLTNLLKGGIFSLIMLAPLIAIGVSCLYVVNNKNAYQSYYGETINQSEKVYINNNDYDNTKTYYINTADYKNSTDAVGQGQNLYVSNFKVELKGDMTDNQYNNLTNYEIYRILYRTSNGTRELEYYYYNESTNGYSWLVITSTNYVISFNISSITSPTYNYYIYELKYNDYSYLDNVFYYSIHNLENQSTFNWVQNTAIYVPLNAMCSGLGITESAIPILLCYWSLMTAIYIVFDIIIYLFTKITHFIGTN